MRTPAAVWSKSARRYQPHPPTWEYEPGGELKKIAAEGQMFLDGRRWEISRALAGEWVQLERIEHHVLVYYCRNLVRELDLLHQQSTAVDRWWL